MFPYFWTHPNALFIGIAVPRNVILDSAFCAKLADFGSGRVAGFYGVDFDMQWICRDVGKSMIFLNMNDYFHIFST